MKREPIWEVSPPEGPKLGIKTITPWTLLRSRMGMFGTDQRHLARLLKRGMTYVNLRLNGHEDWAMSDCYTMMKAFRIPKERFLDYFGHDPVPLENVNSQAGL